MTEVAAEIAALPANSLLGRSGDLEVYLARAIQIPNTLRELCRLREITFRAAGEGSQVLAQLTRENFFHELV